MGEKVEFLPLGMVAQRVRNLLDLGPNFATARQKLHDLLRAGHLKSFVILPGPLQIAVHVPSHFWNEVGTKRLNAIRYVTNSRSQTGAFTLELREIAQAVVGVLRDRVKSTSSSNVMTETLIASCDDREVYVRQNVLDAWITAEGMRLEDQYHAVVLNQGPGRRRSNSAWESVWQGFAQVLLAEIKRAGVQLPKDDTLAFDIHSAALKLGSCDKMLAVATIKKKIAILLR